MKDDEFWDEEETEYSLPLCPYCAKRDHCDHLFLSFDETFGELGGGYLYDRIDPLTERIKEYFSTFIKENGFDKEFVTPDQSFYYVWAGIKDENDNCHYQVDDFEIDDLCRKRTIIPFLIELSELSTHYYYSGCGGFTSESLNVNLYSKDTEKELEDLTDKLEKLLKSQSEQKNNR